MSKLQQQISRPSLTRRIIATAAVAVTPLALTGCAGEEPLPEAPPAAAPDATEGGDSLEEIIDTVPTPEPGPALMSFEDFPFPDCEVVERQVGGALANLSFTSEDVLAPQRPGDSFSKTCMWLTEEAEELEGTDLETLMAAVHTGVLTMSINVTTQPLSEEDAAAGGYAFADLRAEQAGGYVFAPETTDLSDPLGMMGITVAVEGVEVTWGGGTYFDGQGDHIAEQFNKDWGVDAALTVHRLIWN